MFTGHYFIVMLISNFIVLAEKHFSNGRIDCVIETLLYIYIIEFKLNGSAKEALLQIKDKGYATPYMAKGKKVVCLGVNFSSETGTIEGYEVE